MTIKNTWIATFCDVSNTLYVWEENKKEVIRALNIELNLMFKIPLYPEEQNLLSVAAIIQNPDLVGVFKNKH